MSTEATPCILAGIKVLDLSRVLAGPYCTGLLADLGADVVKIESAGGDDARHLGPFKNGESVYFATLNRGKRSIVLDLKDPADHDRFLALVREADVVVENFRPGVTARLGIDYETLSTVNPKLVYASISGFGQVGPFSKRPAYDLVVQAMSGIMASTGPVGGTPTRVGESLGDEAAGLFAGFGIALALFDRSRTGVGRHVDVSMFDSLLALQATQNSLLVASGELPGRIGNRHPVSVPFDTYPTSDGMVAIAVASDHMWQILATAMGRPELGEDPAYLGDMGRAGKLEEITALVSEWTQPMTTEEALAALEAAGIPAAPIWDLKQALASEHVAYRGSTGSFEHPQIGHTTYVHFPVEFGAYGPDHRHVLPPSPALGSSDADGVLSDWTK